MTNKTPAINDFVVVEWRDAYGDALGDYTPQQIAEVKPYIYKTYGVLARNDADWTMPTALIIIASDIGADGGYRGITTIPAAMVITLTLLKRRGKTTRKGAANGLVNS